MRKEILLVVVGAISGCGTHPAVRTTSDKVTIEFVNESRPAFEVLRTYQDDFDCFGLNSEEFSHAVSTNVRTTRRPYQTVGFEYMGVTTGFGGLVSLTCEGTITFPATGADHFKVATFQSGNRCGVRVSKADPTHPGSWSEVPYASRTKTTPFWNTSGPWCKSDTAFQGSSMLDVPRGP